MCTQSQYQPGYCAYRHYADELERSDPGSLLAMFTAYFDDSGTDGNSDIAIAACYVSTKRGWDEFVTAWDAARSDEGFEDFHMSDFMAPPGQEKKPWCDWNNQKKDRVYGRLGKIINRNKRIGVAVAIPKAHWDEAPDWIRGHYGYQHYTVAVRMCMTALVKWRVGSMITLPMRYIFDWEMRHEEKRREIERILDLITMPQNQGAAELLGLEPQGYGFEHKEVFKPLQAADILAWQMRSHMRKIWSSGKDDISLCHPGFKLLREGQEMDLGFFTKKEIDTFVADREMARAKGESFPTLYPKQQ
jgi:hypothetical protein